jgi:catechol 2,3-dioxygenase-like lactoylglutathione lyase family enzyme
VIKGGHVYAALPVQDLERARAFYRDKLGLDPAQDNPGGLLYRLEGGGEFLLYESAYRPGGHTQVNVNVPDVRVLVDELRSRGVVFQEYDYTVDGIAATGPHVSAWFKDSEGNLIGLMGTAR